MKRDYLYKFPRLDGGLNLWEEELDLQENESPRMENLWWENGGLRSREGQSYITAENANGVGYAASSPFWDRVFLHISSSLYVLDHTAAPGEDGLYPLEEVYSGVPYGRGTFFRYGDHLYYKNRGGFLRIAYTPEGETLFTVQKVEDLAYTPVILLNAHPQSGSGDLYQPQNRLTGRKTVKYAAVNREDKVVKSGDGVKRIFPLEVEDLRGVSAVYLGTERLSSALYEVNTDIGSVTFTTAPAEGVEITFALETGIDRYKLPEGDIEAVEAVRVEGTLLNEETDYTVDLILGAVTFLKAPEAENNGVAITYRKEDPEAKKSIMSCRYGGVYGGGVQVCMVLGGCEAQPNALFWNGSDDTAMNPGYWPMPFYNLCGDSAEEVTGFGRQYGELVIFKERSIGKAGWSVEEVNGRDSISLTYQRVNDKTGCDLPWTIALVENNLVFANRELGLCKLLSASAAYENNVSLLSRKVNGTDARPGLLHDLRIHASALGFHDGGRYWLCVGDHVYLWDCRLGSDPRWFYFTGVEAADWWTYGGRRYHLNSSGRVTKMGNTYCDYDGPIPKVYRFPKRNFGSYVRRKRVLWALIALGGGADSDIAVTYRSDWEKREEPVPLRVRRSGLAPRDLTERDLSAAEETAIACRRPDCRNIRHFTLELRNAAAGQDLAPVSLQLVWRYGGRER